MDDQIKETMLNYATQRGNVVQMAQALGYSNNQVEEHFGKDTKTGDPAQLKILFD